MQPGIYELSIGGFADNSWVLVCAGVGCGSVHAEFAQLRSITDGWAGQVSARHEREFTRAALDFLLRRGSGS
jgi:hypothetical protein